MPTPFTPPALPSLEALAAELTDALAPALATSRAAAGGDAGSVARAVIEGKGLPASWKEKLGPDPAATLVAFDADRIQSWVFSSERVQVAGGASKRLEEINRDAGERARRVEGVTGVAYSAGGGGMLFAEPGRDPEQIAAGVAAQLESVSDGLTFTVVATPLHAADLKPTKIERAGSRFDLARGVGGALVRTQVLVTRRKEEAHRPPPSMELERLPGRPAERCPSCGLRAPSAAGANAGDGPGSWCGPCQDRRRHFKGDLGEAAPTFEQFADANRRGRHYLAFLAIDGNGMGNLVQGVRTFLELRAFSVATSEIFAAARDRIPTILADGGFLKPDLPAGESYLSLLSGGDEITVVLPSSSAPAVALELLQAIEAGYDVACRVDGLLGRAFARNTDLLARLRRVGAPAGLLMAPGTYPVRLMRRYAAELQKRAKRRCAAAARDGAGERSAVAWKLLTDSSPLTSPRALVEESDENLAGLQARLEHVAAAVEEEVPLSALRLVLDHFQREEASARSLAPDRRRETAARTTASFLRYQVARNDALGQWWRRVQPSEAVDPAFHWLRGGAGDLQRLLDLLSLAAAPGGPPPAGGAS
jgi:thiol-disulfide isomerase/thioredoxin